MVNPHVLPDDLPVPVDDGAAAHLPGQTLPAVSLATNDGAVLALESLGRTQPRTVLYVYPMTGRPGAELPDGWDAIPGARGCTPEACAFRDHHADLSAAGADVFGLSTQSTAEQAEAAQRLHLPFPLLSDEKLVLAGPPLSLPTFEAGGAVRYRRLTMVISDGRIEVVFYPIFPPDGHAREVLTWLRAHPSDGRR